MNINGFSNISAQTLVRIAPKVESLAGQNLQGNEQEATIIGAIRTELEPYRNAGMTLDEARESLMAMRRAGLTETRRAMHTSGMLANTAPGQFIAAHSFNIETGEFRTYATAKEAITSRLNHQRESEQTMISQLMDAINTMRAADPNGGFDVTV